MPFGRRRATSNPASRNPPSASASLAATKAFVKDRNSNAALSSSAAAAALRTHPTSPTPVGETITKRMVRKGSTSSQGSGSQQAPGLRRHSSNGSMTERTFRAPSPSRNSPVVGHHHDAPPVPAVPKDVPSVSVAHRRASSLEPSFRGGSPVGRGGGRGVSLDRGVAPAPGRGQRVMSLQQVPEDGQDGRPQSVNFSRPMSPSASPTMGKKSGHSGWFASPVVDTQQGFRDTPLARPKTSDGASPFDLHSAQHAVQNAAARPVSTKKTQLTHGVEGARLATGSMRAKPSGTHVPQPQSQAPARAVDPTSPYAVYDPSTRRFIHKQDAMARFRQLNEENEEPTQHYVDQRAPPPRQQSPPRQRASQPAPLQYVDIHERFPSPPPETVERPAQQEVERTSHTHEGSVVSVEEVEARSLTPPPDRGAQLARQSSEDFADADTKPSVDANISRKLESSAPDPGGPTSPKFSSNLDSSYPRVPTPVASAPNAFLAIKGRGNERTDRTHSLSPPRNAHFAAVAVDLSNGILHQPPPRSVSPAKSALKASPSASRRNSSPFANNGRVVSKGAASEASDTMSEDGPKKKKKTVRVSFEEAPVIAGTSAYGDVETPTSPTGLGQSKWSSSRREQDLDLDDLMKPRSALPLFGSIRDKNRRSNDGDGPEKVTETVSSSLSTSIVSIGEPLEASSDHAVGGILAQDLASKKQAAPLEPLPPEVTSVEGSGYYSESSDQSDTAPMEAITPEPPKAVEPEQSLPEPKTLTTPVESNPPAPEVPAIAIQPATPAPIEIPEPKFQAPFIPGGWGEDEESEREEKVEVSDIKQVMAPMSVKRSKLLQANVSQSESLPISQPEEDSSSEDNSSIYSDAYEEQTDTEDGGFASIDALVESPITSSPSGLMHSRYADTTPADPAKSSLRNEYTGVTKKDPPPAPSDDWDPMQQHRNGLGDSQRQNQPVEPVPESAAHNAPVTPAVSAASPADPIAPKAAIKSKEKAPRKTNVTSAPKPAKQVQSSPSPAQPRKSAMKKTAPAAQPTSTSVPEQRMKKTMRGDVGPQVSAPSEPRMKKTMRGDIGPQVSTSPEPRMRKSMRTGEPAGTSKGPSGLAASRHSMPPVETKPPKGALQKKHIPATAPAPKPRLQNVVAATATKPMVTAPTYDSDSDASASSFQRQRPRSSRGGGARYTMRSSMRSDAAPTMRDTPTMRPMSPPETTASPPPAPFRKSLRPSSPTPEPSAVRSSRFSIRSLSPAGRYRPSKTAPSDAPPLPLQTSSPKRGPIKRVALEKASKTKTATKAPKSRFNSRFADSSDEEDEDRPRRFQSRFADSDDDDDFELPPGLTPVRGIPKRPGDEGRDSTDLEDEASDDEPLPKKAASKDVEKGLLTNGNANGEGAAFTAGSLRKSKHAPELPDFEPGKKAKTKRGFFGLGKKKAIALEPTGSEVESSADANIPMPPVHRDRDRSRPLTPIGEDDKSLEATPTQRSPKLQRRSTPQWGRSASDSWPLPQPPQIGQDARPQSSDGVPARKTSLRPTLTKRNSSQISEARTAIDPKTGKEVIVGRTGKKKKFQGLRRVFGLND